MNHLALANPLSSEPASSLSWRECWALLPPTARRELAAVPVLALTEFFESHLDRLGYCIDCRRNVEDAYDILNGALDAPGSAAAVAAASEAAAAKEKAAKAAVEAEQRVSEEDAETAGRASVGKKKKKLRAKQSWRISNRICRKPILMGRKLQQSFSKRIHFQAANRKARFLKVRFWTPQTSRFFILL